MVLTVDFNALSKQILKDENMRESLLIQQFSEVKQILSEMKKGDIIVEELFDILCFLRNSCINCKQNQDRICNEEILTEFSDVIDLCLSPQFCSSHQNKDFFGKLKVATVQFLGNLIVQNSLAKEKVWKLGFPSLFFKFLSSFNDKEKDIFCMVIYNCVKDRDPLFSSDDEFWLLVSVLQHCDEYKEAEWGIFVMEAIVASNHFERFFKQLDYPNLKGNLLDVMHSHLDGNTLDIPERNISYLSQHYSAKAITILQLAVTVSEELTEQANLLIKNLEVLCAAAIYVEKYPKLRSDDDLFLTLLKILSKVSSTELSSFFSHPCDPTIKDSELHPVFGFKRDLIKLIGSLVYENTVFQNVIRENDGIKCILNACNIDNKNPFIMQYAILAIRNICYGNEQNQSYIKSLEKQGVVSNNFLTKCNVTASVRNGKIVVSENMDT